MAKITILIVCLIELARAKLSNTIDLATNDQFNVSRQCQRTTSQVIIDCMQLKFNQGDAYLKPDQNDDQSNKRFECCAMWDMADCALDAIKKNCGPDDYKRANETIIQFQNSTQAIECRPFNYLSDQCQSLWETKLLPGDKKQPWSDHCQRVINKAGVDCRDLVLDKHNGDSNLILRPMSIPGSGKTKKTKTVDNSGDCCPLLEAVTCLEAQVKTNCSDKEYETLHQIDQNEFKLVCPDFDINLCHFDSFPVPNNLTHNDKNNLSSSLHLNKLILFIISTISIIFYYSE